MSTPESSETWQADIRSKIEDLESALTLSNNGFGAWELEFIESVATKLLYGDISVTPKQYDKIMDLWERL